MVGSAAFDVNTPTVFSGGDVPMTEQHDLAFDFRFELWSRIIMRKENAGVRRFAIDRMLRIYFLRQWYAFSMLSVVLSNPLMKRGL